MPRDLPSGTVSFLFTDVEGSTRLLHELGAEAYAQALADHRRLVRDAFTRHGGVEVDTQGDALFVAFPTATGALLAAKEAQEALAPGRIRVRMGIHTGTPHLADEGYVGADVHRAARIAAVGHGGQVLVSSSTASLLAGDELRDLGEHRLKDLSAPERIYQLGEGEFPPLQSLHPTNLPIPATPFLGRDRELAEVDQLLAREDVRLLTLTGPGGTGKTRLALQAAGEAAERYPQGVWWVPLASLRDPELVLASAAQALGAKDDVADHISDKRLLLLLDNFEHVVDAAVGIADLLASCPNLRVLVTSRELLAVPGEQAYPVPPLEPRDGTALFLARARAARPDFVPTDAVPVLCTRLDNLPLALELAAARVRMLSAEELLERLSRRLDLLQAGRGTDPRQQTLRATIEWSYALLNTQEQELFARLSVFLGGCTLGAAEEVCAADLDVLQSLVDKSLVRRRDDRFWMLGTIREYASERLGESREAEQVRRRHAEYFLALAKEAEPHLLRAPKEWLDRLRREQDNFRAALDRTEEARETELALPLAAALGRFWYLRGDVAEGRRRLESALAADASPTAARGRALTQAALLAMEAGDAATARRRAEEAVALHQHLGDAWGIAYARFLVANILGEEGDLRAAERLFGESVLEFDEFGDDHMTLIARFAVARARHGLGDLEGARNVAESTLQQARSTGNRRMEAMSIGFLGRIALDEGDVDDALASLKGSLAIHRELGDLRLIPMQLSLFAHGLALLGRARTAAVLLSSSEMLREQITRDMDAKDLQRNEKTVAKIQGEIDEAAFAEAWGEGRSMTLDEAVELALREGSVSVPGAGIEPARRSRGT